MWIVCWIVLNLVKCFCYGWFVFVIRVGGVVCFFVFV